MLPMFTWAALSSRHTATKRLAGFVISAQMATCTAGQPESGKLLLLLLPHSVLTPHLQPVY